MPPLELSIVMPAWNEEVHIEACVAEWHDAVLSRLRGELVVVDDCSRDRTGALLTALAGRYPDLRVFRTPRNSGHGAAVRLGLEQASGMWVFQTDSDRQHVPADISRLWEVRDGADFVFGARASRADGRVRMLISRLLRTVNVVLWGRDIADANCPFKLMRRDAMRAVLAEVPRGTFIPMVMVSVLARFRGYRVVDVPVPHFPRTGGEASLRGGVRWLSVGLRCVRELLALRLAVLRRPSPAAGATGTMGARD